MLRSRIVRRSVALLVAVALGFGGAPVPTRADLIAAGPVFQVNTTTAGDQRAPAVAMAPDGSFVVVWQSVGQDGSGEGIFGQRFAPDASRAGLEFQVNTTIAGDQVRPAVAMAPDGSFVVVWQSFGQDGSGFGLYAQRYTADGTPIGGEVPVNATTARDQLGAAIAIAPDGSFVVAWQTNTTGSWRIAGRRFGSSGAPVGGDVTIADGSSNTLVLGDQRDPTVAIGGDGGFVVGWRSDGRSGTGVGYFLRRYTASGTPLGPEVQANQTPTDGSSNTLAFGEAPGPSVGMEPDGSVVLVWQSLLDDGKSWNINGRRFAADGTAIGREFRANPSPTSTDGTSNTVLFGEQPNPTVGMGADGRFVVAWQSAPDGRLTTIVGQRYGADGGPVGGVTRITNGTSNTLAFDSRVPAVAVNADGRFVVVWQADGRDGSGGGIYARLYEREFRVNTTTASDQADPSVAMAPDGRSVVAWESAGQDTANSYGIYAQRYAADGSPLGDEFRVNTTTAGQQRAPAVAMAGDGRFVVAWHSLNQDGSGMGVFARRYGADGSPLGIEFRVNTTTADHQASPSVAMAGDGRFVVAWESAGQDGSGFGIFARRYGADGVPLGGEFPVNTTTANDQRVPSAAMVPDGRFAVAWQSVLAGGTGTGVFARAYDAGGSPITGEFRVNTGSATQVVPRVGMAADGRFVVAWQSTGEDGSGTGVFFQRHAATGAPLGGQVRANLTTAGDQRAPALAVAGDFTFVLAWESVGQDGGGSGIYARQFGSDGTALTGEVRGSQTAAGDQLRPAVGLGSGAALVAWDSPGQDGGGTGVFAKQFEVTTTGSTGTFAVQAAKQVRVGQSTTVRFRWTVPQPATWRDLARLQLRLVDEQGTALWLRWREADDTWLLIDPVTERAVASGKPGGPRQLVGPAAALELRGTRTRGSGPSGQHVDLELRLSFLDAAARRKLRIEVAASNDQGQGDDFARAGQVHVLAPRPPQATSGGR